MFRRVLAESVVKCLTQQSLAIAVDFRVDLVDQGANHQARSGHPRPPSSHLAQEFPGVAIHGPN